MSTRLTLRTELRARLNDPTSGVWTDDDLNGYIEQAIKGLYPTYYLRETGEVIAGAGPLQTLPAGAKNLHYVGQQRVSSTRVRKVRGWSEGDGQVIIPKTGIAGDTIVVAWTTGFTAPSDDVTVLDLTPEAEEVVVLRSQIAALERILADRVKQEKFYSLSIREGVTEDDIERTLAALHDSVDARTSRAVPLPEVQV